ncbi:MAG: hypothetical protein WCK90_03995 [archaeon]
MESEKTNKQENRIRISAASLARIMIDGKLLVGLNKSRLKAGKRVYTMFGGGLEFNEKVRPYLQSLDAVFEKGNDIRLDIPEAKVGELESWFYKRQDRELDVYRELKEEFVEEEHVLSELEETAVQRQYLFTVRQRAVSDRPGQSDKITQRYLEVHKVELDQRYVDSIKAYLKTEDCKLALVSQDEVLNKKTASGVDIAVDPAVFDGMAK